MYETGFRVSCGTGGCPRVYSSIRCLNRHAKKVHADFMKKDAQECQPDYALGYLQGGAEDAGNGDAEEIDDATYMEGNFPRTQQQQKFDYEKRIAAFLLSLRHHHKVLQSATHALAHELGELLKLNNEMLIGKVEMQLQDSDPPIYVDLKF